jgi:hypothetical protein
MQPIRQDNALGSFENQGLFGDGTESKQSLENERQR